jgi:hypothetical protein
MIVNEGEQYIQKSSKKMQVLFSQEKDRHLFFFPLLSLLYRRP